MVARGLRWTVVFVSAVFFVGCQKLEPIQRPSKKKAQNVRVLSPAVDYFRENFKEGKIQMKSRAAATVPAGTQLSAVVDNDCMMRTSGELSSAFADRAHPDLDKQAYVLSVDEDMALAELADLAEKDDCVIGVSEIGRFQLNAVPNDPMFAELNHHSEKNLNSAQAWDIFFGDDGIQKDVIVAVVDTGVSYTHRDLIENMYVDQNGKHGFDFVDQDDDPTDLHGHGTHVAGIIGATMNNSIGVPGVMGKNVKLMAVRVMNESGTSVDIANGILYAVANGAQVINLSLGATYYGDPDFFFPDMKAAIEQAVAQGVVVVMAAGNDGFSLDRYGFFPGNQGHLLQGAITVGSLDAATRSPSSFSNYSERRVEIFAPGDDSSFGGIFSTYPDDLYVTMRGTSMAAPMVAGAAALAIGWLESHGQEATPARIEELIRQHSPVNPALNGRVIEARNLELYRLALGVSGQEEPIPAPQVLVFADKPSYVQGESMLVSWDARLATGEPLTAKDWIALVPAGTRLENAKQLRQSKARWFRTGGNLVGSKKLALSDALSPGLYELVYYHNGGYVEKGRSQPVQIVAKEKKKKKKSKD